MSFLIRKKASEVLTEEVVSSARTMCGKVDNGNSLNS